MKIIFYDLETTGFANACGIHQISLILTKGHEHINSHVFDTNPGSVRFDKEALELANKTVDDIKNHPPILEIKRQFDEILLSHIDVHDPTDRWTLCGYNNNRFDNRFWHQLYASEFPNVFNDIYLPNTLDVLVMVKDHFKNKDEKPEKFNLGIVAKYFGIEVDDSELHRALYDAHLTREIFLKLITLTT